MLHTCKKRITEEGRIYMYKDWEPEMSLVVKVTVKSNKLNCLYYKLIICKALGSHKATQVQA